MRTEKQWKEKLYPKILREFTPRLQDDLVKIPYKLTDIPEFGGYYIHGGVNSGKTLLAAHMYIAACKRRYMEALPGAFLFINAYDFFLALKKSFDDPATDEHAVLAKYSSAAYLVLDDLGSTKFTEWSISQLQILVNNRYEQLLPTVYTSNLDLEELAEALGDDRIPSRMKRTCKILKKK